MNKKFLLADDDADDADVFCTALTRTIPGTECHTVENGLELLDLLARQDSIAPDVIFLDINMPIMNGWECLKKLKDDSVFKSIPTIMYSTSSARKDIDMAYRMGAQLFVTKPEDVRELAQILEIVASSVPESLSHQLKGFQSVKLN